MKKAVAGILTLALIMCIGFAAASAGTASDPLVSKDYVDGTFSDGVISQGTSSINSALEGVYTSATEELVDKALASSGYSYSAGYDDLSIAAGKYVYVYTGGSFVLTSGTVSVYPDEGTVIDLTNGGEKRNGEELSINRRYFSAEDTSAIYKVETNTQCLINGYYKIVDTAELPPEDDEPFREFGPDVFIDVSQEDWFYTAVGFVYSNYIFNGIEENEFGAYENITRADFVTVLYRMAGSPAITTVSEYPDVQDSSLYYYDAVIWGSENGIVLGHDTGLFDPESSITREQMTAFMYRYAVYEGYDLSIAYPDRYDSFPDTDEVSDWAVSSMDWAVGNAIINGTDGYLDPQGKAERCQVAQIIFNLYAFTM